jgi:lysosomal alpha-mannosidase
LADAEIAFSDNLWPQNSSGNLKLCHHLMPGTFCPIIEDENESDFNLIIYNSQGQYASDYIRIPLKHLDHKIKITSGNAEVGYSLVPTPVVLRSTLPQRAVKFEAIFFAENIPPLGYRQYKVEKLPEKIQKTPKLTPITINMFKSYLPKGLSIEMGYFKSDESPTNHPSGAYVFSPTNEKPVLPDVKSVKMIQTEHIMEFHVILANSWGFVARNYSKKPHLEVFWMVPPIDVKSEAIGKEAIISYKMAKMATLGSFYTDSNGRESVKRQRNNKYGLAGNFYPVTTSIFVQANHKDLSILTDRSQAGGSIHDGEVYSAQIAPNPIFFCIDSWPLRLF